LSVTALAIWRGLLQRGRVHGVGLPAFHVVAADLHMADGFAEVGFDAAILGLGAHGQQGDLVVEVDEALDDDAAVAHAAAGHGVVPGFLHVAGPSILLWPLPELLITGLTMQG
jgi:hypothetical protein